MSWAGRVAATSQKPRQAPQADVNQFRVGETCGLDVREFLVADRAAGLDEIPDKADQSVAPDIAGRLAGANVLQSFSREARHLPEQTVRGGAVIAAH